MTQVMVFQYLRMHEDDGQFTDQFTGQGSEEEANFDLVSDDNAESIAVVVAGHQGRRGQVRVLVVKTTIQGDAVPVGSSSTQPRSHLDRPLQSTARWNGAALTVNDIFTFV